jgi:hypothetical protein
VTRGLGSRNSHHPFGHPTQRLVFRMERFECRSPLVVPPFVETSGQPPLQAVDLGFQSRVPGDLPTPPQPVLQAYPVLNSIRYRRPWETMRTTLRCRSLQLFPKGVGEVLNERVHCHPFVQFQIEWNLIFQMS